MAVRSAALLHYVLLDRSSLATPGRCRLAEHLPGAMLVLPSCFVKEPWSQSVALA